MPDKMRGAAAPESKRDSPESNPKLKPALKAAVFFLALLGFCAWPLPLDAGPLSGRTVVLDPGHGSNSFEGARMLVLGNFIRDELESRGASVLMTRPERANTPLALRPLLTNKWALESLRDQLLRRFLHAPAGPEERAGLKAQLISLKGSLDLLGRAVENLEGYAHILLNHPFDPTVAATPDQRRILGLQDSDYLRHNWLFISLHANFGASESWMGVCIFYSSNDVRLPYFSDYTHSEYSRRFAQILLGPISRSGLGTRTGVNRSSFMVIRETNIPAVLVENGHYTNHANLALLRDNDFMRRLAAIYADAIVRHFAEVDAGRFSGLAIDGGGEAAGQQS